MEFKTDKDKSDFLKKQLGTLEQTREPYEYMVNEVIKYVNHSRRLIGDEDTRSGSQGKHRKGNKTGTYVYDGTALSAVNLASDGIHGYMCSSNLHWFDFILPGKMNFPRTSGMRQWSGKRLDEYPGVKAWLDDCEEVLYAAYTRSNFYDFHPEYVKEGMSIGTGTVILEEDVGKGRTIFTMPHFRECYIAENQFGEVDTLYRKHTLNLKQLVQKFGEEKVFALDTSFKLQYEKDPYTAKEVVHATFPRTDYDPTKLNSKNKPVASFWMLTDANKNKIIDESGFYEIPTVTWRWRKNVGELYGRSPSWDAYVDIMKGNQQARTNLVAAHKMVDPPMTAPSDLRGRVSNVPGGWTWIDGDLTKDRVPVPLQTGIQLPYSIDQQERTDKAIKEHFHVDFFLMLNQAAFNKIELTATQVMGMQGEQAAVLGTRVGRHQSEALNPIMDRMWNIEQRAGRLPEPPEILLEHGGGQRIEIDYMGPLSQAQRRLFKLQSIRGGIEVAAQIAQVFNTAVDVVDGDKTMTEALDAVGFPAKCVRNPGEVDKIRKVRQAAMEEEQEIAKMGEMAKAGQRLTRKVEEGSIMDGLTDGALSERAA